VWRDNKNSVGSCDFSVNTVEIIGGGAFICCVTLPASNTRLQIRIYQPDNFGLNVVSFHLRFNDLFDQLTGQKRCAFIPGVFYIRSRNTN
jgi:hypothetical protein